MTDTLKTPIGGSGSTAHEGQGFDVPLGPPSGNGSDDSTSPLEQLRSGIAAWLNVGVTLGESVEKMSRSYEKLMAQLERGTPVDYGNGVAGAFPASGVLALVLGTPDQGTRWEVTNVVVGGVDAFTAAAGAAALYVSALAPQNNQAAPGGLLNCADIAKSGTLPNPAFYGTRQLIVNDQEYLFVVISGGTAGQVYVANFSTTVFNVAAAQGRDITIL